MGQVFGPPCALHFSPAAAATYGGGPPSSSSPARSASSAGSTPCVAPLATQPGTPASRRSGPSCTRGTGRPDADTRHARTQPAEEEPPAPVRDRRLLATSTSSCDNVHVDCACLAATRGPEWSSGPFFFWRPPPPRSSTHRRLTAKLAATAAMAAGPPRPRPPTAEAPVAPGGTISPAE